MRKRPPVNRELVEEMKKKKEEQLCLFNPSYEEVLSWDGMNSITPYRLSCLLNRFSVEKTIKRRKRKK